MVITVTFIASGLALLAEGKYIVSIFRGKTKPNFSGWFIFTVSMGCVLASAYSLGARDSLPLIATFMSLHFIVALLSLKYGIVRFTRVDVSMLILSVVGLFLWWQTENAWYALILNILIDMFGYVTIATKLYRHPETEDKLAWMISALAYSLNLIGVTRWVPQEYLFSLSNVIWCSTILFLAFRPTPSSISG